MQLFMGARQLRMEASARDLGLYLPAPRRRAKAVKGGERGRSLSQLLSVVYKMRSLWIFCSIPLVFNESYIIFLCIEYIRDFILGIRHYQISLWRIPS